MCMCLQFTIPRGFFFSFPSNAEVETSKFSGSALMVSRFFFLIDLQKRRCSLFRCYFLQQSSVRQSIWSGSWILSPIPCAVQICQCEGAHSPRSRRNLQHKSCFCLFLTFQVTTFTSFLASTNSFLQFQTSGVL